MMGTLYARLAAVLVFVLLAIAVAYALITTSTTRQYTQAIEQRFNKDLARNMLADRNLVAEGRINEAALRDLFRMYMDINPNIEIYLLDAAGTILSYSADAGAVERQRVDLTPIRTFLDGDEFPVLGDDPRSSDRHKAFSVVPIRSAGTLEGYLYVVLGAEAFDALEEMEQGRYVLRLSAWAVAASLGFGLLAGLALFFLLTRRLQRLSALMVAFQSSGFSHHQRYSDAPRRRGADEIDRLGESFDQMAQRITSLLQRLKEQDEQRRESVAQVSHDLRTPLASLQGYLETLHMKEGELDQKTRKEYLVIALRQSQRLTRLVEELFELARLEAEQTRPRSEPFSASELVQDVVQKFQVNAERADVELAMRSPGKACTVAADIALTERVLDNLIGNAIEHTPANGRVELSLQSFKHGVSVAVADTGPGIRNDDLQKVFEPFYRSGGRFNDEAHAGLGLAISRRIVELQGGKLRAANGPERGSVFTFTLPAP